MRRSRSSAGGYCLTLGAASLATLARAAAPSDDRAASWPLRAARLTWALPVLPAAPLAAFSVWRFEGQRRRYRTLTANGRHVGIDLGGVRNVGRRRLDIDPIRKRCNRPLRGGRCRAAIDRITHDLSRRRNRTQLAVGRNSSQCTRVTCSIRHEGGSRQRRGKALCSRWAHIVARSWIISNGTLRGLGEPRLWPQDAASRWPEPRALRIRPRSRSQRSTAACSPLALLV